MKQLLLTFTLALTISSAMAEWSKVIQDESGAVVTYFEYDTLKREGDTVKVWELVDYKFGSTKTLAEYDCMEQRIRSHSGEAFNSGMGEGKIISTNNKLGDWRKVLPETVGQTLWKIACDKSIAKPKLPDVKPKTSEAE